MVVVLSIRRGGQWCARDNIDLNHNLALRGALAVLALNPQSASCYRQRYPSNL